MNTEILIGGISLILGFLVGYLTSFVKEKGKNSALIEDLEKITEEKEKVSAKFELDISKRKYKYEDKRTQYFKYFNLLDQLSVQSNKEAQEEFYPAITEFNISYLTAYEDIEKVTIATANFMNAVNKIMFKSNESFLKLRQETNTIKLIAGPAVSKTLQETEIAYEKALDTSAQMMRDLAENIITQKQDIQIKQQSEIEEIGKSLLLLKEKLIQEVKNELDEI